jgi:biotin operon repressor
MSSQKEILESLEQEPLSLAQLAEKLSVKPQGLTKTMADLKKKGFITHSDEGVYSTTEKGLNSLVEEPKPTGEVLPSEFDEFIRIGASLGIKSPFLENVAVFIFRLGHTDINAVYANLGRLALRPDIVARWTAMWGSFLGKPLPQQLNQAAEALTGSQSGQARHLYLAIGGNVVATSLDDLDGLPQSEAIKLALFQQQQQQSQRQPGDGVVAELRSQVDTLRTQMSQEREARLTEQLSSVQNQLVSLQNEVRNLGTTAKASSEYDIMSQGIGLLDRRAASIESLFKGMVRGGMPTPMTQEQRARITGAMEQQAEADAELDELGRRLLQIPQIGREPLPFKPQQPGFPQPAPRPERRVFE